MTSVALGRRTQRNSSYNAGVPLSILGLVAMRVMEVETTREELRFPAQAIPDERCQLRHDVMFKYCVRAPILSVLIN